MQVVVITSESEYNFAASRIETLSDADPGTAEAMELKLLIQAIADYHRGHQ